MDYLLPVLPLYVARRQKREYLSAVQRDFLGASIQEIKQIKKGGIVDNYHAVKYNKCTCETCEPIYRCPICDKRLENRLEYDAHFNACYEEFRKESEG